MREGTGTSYRALLFLLGILLSACGFGQEQSRDLVLTRVGTKASLPVYTGSHALIVGVNKYANLGKDAQLRYAVNDAKGMRDTLVDYYGFPAENVTVLLDDEATLKNIYEALDQLSNRAKVLTDDRVLVYFSGHGQTVRGTDGADRGFLIPHDAKVDLSNPGDIRPFEATSLPMQELWNRLDPSPAKHIAVIADACFSGLLTKPRSLFEENPLAAFLTMPARQAVSAGGKGQKTWETDANRHGVFTFNLLSEMRKRAKEKQRVFTMLDLFSSIQSKVLVDSKNRQIPQINQFFTEGQMLFFTTGDKPAPDKPPVGGAVVTTDPGKKPEIAKLSVKSNPAGAKVFVDDEEIGETPLTKEYEVDKNRKIEVRLELEGYEVRKKTVELRPKRETKIDERLKKIPVPPKPKPAKLVVVTSPAGASLSIDGQDIGNSPLQKEIEVPGNKSVIVRMSLEGYETAERAVELRPGRESKITVTLVKQPDRPKKTTLEIVTTPPGADISVDGVPLGKSPVTYSVESLSPTTISVRASLAGHAVAEQSTTLEPGSASKLEIALKKVGVVEPPKVGAFNLRSTVMVRHSGPIRNVQFSPDGTKVAITGQDNALTIYDVRSGSKLREFTEPVTAFLRLSSDWRYLMYIYLQLRGTSGNLSVMVQELDNPNSAKVFSAAMGVASVLNFASATGGQLVVCGQGAGGRAAIAIMDLESGKSDSFEISGRLQGARASSDGNTIAVFRDPMSLGQDTNLFLLRGKDREDRQQVRLIDSNVGQGLFFSQTNEAVAINAGMRTSATASNQRGLKVFEARDGKMRFSSRRHVAIGFMAGGTRLLGWSEAQGGSIELFDAVSGASLGAQKSPRPWLSDDGNLIAVPVIGGFEVSGISAAK
jgi:WD40 repeat protein